MKHKTLMFLFLGLGVVVIVYFVASPGLKVGGSAGAGGGAGTSTNALSSIFNFGTALVNDVTKVLPSFMKKEDPTPDPTQSNLTAYASSSGFADHSDP